MVFDKKNEFIQYGIVLNALKDQTVGLNVDLTDMALTVSKLTPIQQALALSTKDLTRTQIEEVMSLNDVEKAQIRQALTTVGVIKAKKDLTEATLKNILVSNGLQAEKAQEIIQTGVITTAVNGESFAKRQVAKADLAATLAQQGLSNTQIKAIMTEMGLGTVTLSLSAYFKGLAVSTLTAAKALGKFLFTNPVGWLITAAGAIIGITVAISKYNKKQEEAAQAAADAQKKAVENIETHKQEIKSLEDLQSRYTELVTSTSDLSTIKKDLQGIQDELTDKYGDEAKAIDIVNGKYSEQIALMKEKKLEEAKESVRQNKVEYDNAKKILSDGGKVIGTQYVGGENPHYIDIRGNETSVKAVGVGGWGETTVQNWSKFDNVLANAGQNEVWVAGTLEEQYETLTEMADIYSQQEGYHERRLQLLRDEATKIKERLDNAKEIVREHESNLNIIEDLEIPDNVKTEFNALLDKAVETNNTLNETNSPSVAGQSITELDEIETKLRNLAGTNTELQSIVDSTFTAFESGSYSASTSLSSLNEKYSEFIDENFKNTTDNVTKIEEAMQELANGELIDNEKAWELFDLDKNGAIGIPELIDGKYKISIEELIKLKDEVIQKTLEEIETEKANAQESLSSANIRLSAAEKELELLKTNMTSVNSASDAKILDEKEQAIKSLKEEMEGYNKIINGSTLLIRNFNAHLGNTVDEAEALKSRIEAAQSEADELLKAQETKIDSIVDSLNNEKSEIEKAKSGLEDQLEVLQDQQEEIEGIISNYEKVSDIVGDVIQDEIDSINDARQGVEDYYDEMINKLQDTNKEREESINLAEKLAALENAKKNKERVFDEARGWVYESNKENVDSAKEDLLNAQNEAEISRLEKEKENALVGYDEQIDSLEAYSKQWGESLNAITDAENEALAEQILGADWREQIKTQDTEILNNFQNNYNSYKGKLSSLVNGEIADLNRSIQAKENEIAAKDKQIKSWQDYKTNIQNAANGISSVFDEYTGKLNQLSINENSSYEQRLANFNTFVSNYAAKINEINELNNSVNSLNIGGDSSLSFLDKFAEAIQKILEKLEKSPTGYGIINSAWDAQLAQGERFAKGGVNTTTGLAWLDGTKNAAETIFNATDSKKLYDLVHGSNSLVGMFRDKIDKSTARNNIQTNNKTSNINVQFGDIVANNPEAFATFMKDYLHRVRLESELS